MIEGVSVQAVVDCGVPSSIISRDLLDHICNHMGANGHGRPKQGQPTLKLFGTGGTDNGELCISGMTELELSIDGLAVKAPMFIQPAIKIQCLLGTNVLPKLDGQSGED